MQICIKRIQEHCQNSRRFLIFARKRHTPVLISSGRGRLWNLIILDFSDACDSRAFVRQDLLDKEADDIENIDKNRDRINFYIEPFLSKLYNPRLDVITSASLIQAICWNPASSTISPLLLFCFSGTCSRKILLQSLARVLQLFEFNSDLNCCRVSP